MWLIDRACLLIEWIIFSDVENAENHFKSRSSDVLHHYEFVEDGSIRSFSPGDGQLNTTSSMYADYLPLRVLGVYVMHEHRSCPNFLGLQKMSFYVKSEGLNGTPIWWSFDPISHNYFVVQRCNPPANPNDIPMVFRFFGDQPRKRCTEI